MIIDKNEWLIRNVLKSKLHTCVASEYGVAEFLSTSNDPNIGIPELEGLSCCCGTILRAENYNKFLLITSLLICDRDDTHCTRKKIRSVEGRRNDSMLRISFFLFSYDYIRIILFDISLEQSFFFFFFFLFLSPSLVSLLRRYPYRISYYYCLFRLPMYNYHHHHHYNHRTTSRLLGRTKQR